MLMLYLSEARSRKAVIFHPVLLEQWKDIKDQGERECMINYVLLAERDHRGDSRSERAGRKSCVKII